MTAVAPYSSHYVTCAGREIHYTDWPAATTSPKGNVIAWHGLARTGRDMDELAAHLSARGYRVICPDTIGRGLSEWSTAPGDEYCLAFYARIARELLVQLQLDAVHWVGTSMGGAIGMVGASGYFEPELKRCIKSLVLNDNAPELARAAIERIKAYAGSPPAFATVRDLEAFFRTVYKPYGWLSDAQWRRLTETSTRRLPDGRVTPHYDPAMVQQFVNYPDDYSVWHHYDALQIPVLCLRGAESDLVLRETTQKMQARGPGAAGRLTVVEVPGCGHAPALNVPSQLDLVTDFIVSGNTSAKTAPMPLVALRAEDAPARTKPSNYPEPFASMMTGRLKRPLGDLFGLLNFGVNLTRLAPHAVSALRHAHTRQDEFIYVLQGRPILVTDEGRTPLEPDMCAGFRAGTGNGHSLVNETAEDVVYLELGDRTPGDAATYPDDDLQATLVDGSWKFAHKDGTPY